MSSIATPQFLITNLGLAVASTASPTGPWISITSFQIGDGYGYTPDINDIGLNGNLLFEGTPTSYENVGNNTINIICDIPPNAGPFNFGEVALFLSDGTMFAKAVFDTPQTKYSSLGSGVATSYTLNCLLKLQQSVAVFQITTLCGPPSVWEAYSWSEVYPPGQSANPDIPLTMVRELSPFFGNTLLQPSASTIWTVTNEYNPYYNVAIGSSYYPVMASSTSWIEVPASHCHSSDLSAPNRRFLILTPEGYLRSVSSVVSSGTNYRFNLNVTNDGTYNNYPLPVAPSPSGEYIRIYRCDQAGGTLFYNQIVDPPAQPPLAQNNVPGLAYGSLGIFVQNGAIQAAGLLHAPSQNTGRILTGSDDLNSTAFASGVYTTASATYGFPANMPYAWDGNIVIIAYGDYTQIYYPQSTGGGDAQGNNGVPIAYRSWTGSSWTSWFPLLMGGKQGGTGLWSTSNFNPLTVNGIGYVAFIVLQGNSSQAAPEGTVRSLPGRPGTWLSNGTASAASDYWNVWVRIA